MRVILIVLYMFLYHTGNHFKVVPSIISYEVKIVIAVGDWTGMVWYVISMSCLHFDWATNLALFKSSSGYSEFKDMQLAICAL